MVALAAVSVGCAVEHGEAVETSSVQLVTNFERVLWEPVLDADDWLTALPDETEGPCSCNTNQCSEDWVDETFGCNVCVAVHCADTESKHICVAC